MRVIKGRVGGGTSKSKPKRRGLSLAVPTTINYGPQTYRC